MRRHVVQNIGWRRVFDHSPGPKPDWNAMDDNNSIGTYEVGKGRVHEPEQGPDERLAEIRTKSMEFADSVLKLITNTYAVELRDLARLAVQKDLENLRAAHMKVMDALETVRESKRGVDSATAGMVSNTKRIAETEAALTGYVKERVKFEAESSVVLEGHRKSLVAHEVWLADTGTRLGALKTAITQLEAAASRRKRAKPRRASPGSKLSRSRPSPAPSPSATRKDPKASASRKR